VIGVRVSVTQGTVLEALGQLALAGGQKAELLDEIGISVAENTRLRFLDQEAPDGTPWVPSLRAKQQGGETMRDTGRLMNSISHAVAGDSVEVGTNVPYAYPLHFGAEIRAVNGPYLRFRAWPGGPWASKKTVTLPARPFLGITDEDATSIALVINNFLSVK
jgi:phage virion morphogenesis protein